MNRIYGAPPALHAFLVAREKGFASPEEAMRLMAAVDAEKAAADANRRASTAALLGKFGLDENLEPRPGAKE